MSQEIEQLIEEFRDASLKHHQATLDGYYKVTNREADRVHRVFLKLRELGPEAREALIQVAIQGDGADASAAAVYSLKYDAKRALAVLKRISKDRGILGFEASWAIKNWKSGDYHLE